MIRLMKPADEGRVIELYWHSHIEEYVNEPYPIKPKGVRDEEALSRLFEQSTCYVYELDGKVQGFIGHIENYIIWLYVDPGMRGRKIGKLLVEFLLPRLSKTAELIVVKSNQTAVDFYTSLGFVGINEFTVEYQGFPVVTLSMAHAVQAGEACSQAC